jgi:hypothetical protein
LWLNILAAGRGVQDGEQADSANKAALNADISIDSIYTGKRCCAG